MKSMKNSAVVSIVAGVLMLSAGALARHLTPTVRIADQQARFDLVDIIPAEFAGWRIDASMVPLQVDPDTQARLDKIYNQTLSRTYVNGQGQRVMLSIAYGGDQSSNMAVHLPETCYGAQGFDVRKTVSGEIGTAFGAVPVKRLFAVNGARQEPITYWITVGDRAIKPGIEQRMQRLRYGLTGMIADAMLVRVSTIEADTPQAYATQAEFVNALLQSIKPEDRARVVGRFGG